MNQQTAERLYRHLWIYTHGIASLCATKVCEFSESEMNDMLTEVFASLLQRVKQEGIMIEIHNITKYYGSNENKFQVLKGLSLDIREKDFVVILGASGSGKSTLLNIISGLERPDRGQYAMMGQILQS